MLEYLRTYVIDSTTTYHTQSDSNLILVWGGGPESDQSNGRHRATRLGRYYHRYRAQHLDNMPTYTVHITVAFITGYALTSRLSSTFSPWEDPEGKRSNLFTSVPNFCSLSSLRVSVASSLELLQR